MKESWTVVKKKGQRTKPLLEVILEKQIELQSFKQDNIPDISSIAKIICLGIGSLEYSAPRYQTAYILELGKRMPDLKSIQIWDPISTEGDIEIFLSLGPLMEVSLAFEDVASYKVSEPTLFYLPHCPHKIYNEVLRDNASQVHLVLMLGNDLREYSERSDLSFCQMAIENGAEIQEFHLANFHSNVFSGAAWHSFPPIDKE
jgi:hypothetical protein